MINCRLTVTGLRRAACCLVTGGLVCVAPNVGQAGDAIVFSGSRKQAEAPGAREDRAGGESLNFWKNASAPASLPSLLPYVPPVRPLDAKEERRLKNARAERAFWMVLEPGELQARDDEESTFGVREYNLDRLEKQDDSGDYTFYNLGVGQARSADQYRPNGHPRTPGQRPTRDDAAAAAAVQAQQQRQAEEEEQTGKSDSRGTLSVFGTRANEAEPGVHTAGQLDLRNLLDTSQTGPNFQNRSEATLYHFLKDNAAPGLSRDQQVRRENFRQFLNASPASIVGAAGASSDPINFRTDFTREGMYPILPKSPAAIEFNGPSPSRPAPDLSLGPGLNSPSSRALSPGLMDLTTPRSAAFAPSLSPGYPGLNEPNRSRETLQPRSSFSRDLPRRGGL